MATRKRQLLQDLKVKSFVTSEINPEKLKGGSMMLCSNHASCVPYNEHENSMVC